MRIRHAIAPRDPSQRRDARFPDLLDHRPRIGGEAVGLLGLRAVTDPAGLGQLGTAELHAPGLGGRQRIPSPVGSASITGARISRFFRNVVLNLNEK